MLDLQCAKDESRGTSTGKGIAPSYKDIHIVRAMAQALRIDLPASLRSRPSADEIQERGGAKQDTACCVYSSRRIMNQGSGMRRRFSW